MPVNLKFYDATGVNPIDIVEGLNLGNFYKGQETISGFTIKNIGDVTASNVRLSFEGADGEAINWKSLGFAPDGLFHNNLTIPDIPPGKYMPGWAVYTSTFEMKENHWDFTHDSSNWEFYNANATNSGYLQHLKSAVGGRAEAGYPEAQDVEVSMKIQLLNGNYGGVQLRSKDGHGYFITLNAVGAWISYTNSIYQHYPGFVEIAENQAVVQIWKGKFMNWGLAYSFPVGAKRNYFDKFKVKLDGNKFVIHYADELIGTWTDVQDDYNRAGRLALFASNGNVTAFDDIEYGIKTELGAVYLKNKVDSGATPAYHQSFLKVEYDE